MPLESNEKNPANMALELGDEAGEDNKSLVFTLKDELYGCSLLKVKEVIKVGAIKPVPYMAPYFKGVLNLRGHVLGVIDLGAKLGLAREADSKGLIVVTETKYGVIGVIVDELLTVTRFSNADIDLKTPVETKIAPVFFEGIGKWNDRLVHLIDLSGLVQEEDFRLSAG